MSNFAQNPFAPHLNFTEADLAENRQGRLSEAQKQAALKGAYMNLYGAPAVAVLLSAGAYYFMNQNGQLERFPLVAVLLIGIFSAIGAFFYYETSQAVKIGKVENITSVPRGLIYRRNILTLDMGERRFMIPVTLRSLFQQGVKYTVYYTPKDMGVVAIEVA